MASTCRDVAGIEKGYPSAVMRGGAGPERWGGGSGRRLVILVFERGFLYGQAETGPAGLWDAGLHYSEACFRC